MSDKLCRIRWGQVRRGLALCLLGVWQSGFNFIDPGHVPSARVAGQTALGAERAKNVPRWLSELQDEGLIEEPDANMCVVLACDAAKRNDWSAGEQWLRRAWGNSSTPDASSVKMLWQVVGQYVPLSVAERWLSLTAVAPQMPYVATALLRAASRGCDLDTAEKWFQAMQSSDPALAVDQSLCLRLLSCSLQSGNTSLAEEWIKRAVKAGAKTSEITMRIMKDSAARRAFEAMIRQTAEATDLAAARRWYDQAVAAGLYPSPRTFAALLEAALNADDSTAADYWYQGVVATPGQPAVVSFNLLLDVAARKGRVKLLRQWFSKMQELGIEPNPETFRTLIMGTVKSAEGDLETAESWYQQALEAGFRLSAGDFEEMIDAALVRNDVESAAFWYKKSADELTLPTEVFNQLLSRAAQLEGFSMAASLFAEFGVGITPNVETFNTMMLAAARNGDTAAAEIWYTRAQGAGCKPDELTYQALINAASKKGDLAAAEAWLRQAEEVGIKPTLKMLNSLMAAASRDGDFQLASGWFHRMEGFNLQPDVVSYTTIISAAAKSGNLAVAEQWFQAAVAQGIAPNVVTFTSLIDAAVRSENDEAARHWYETALKAGVQPSIRTFNTLMSGPARQGDVPSAEKWFRAARFMGAIPDRVTYNTLMNAAARAGDLASAESWYEKALGARVDPNVVTFTTLISAAANQGRQGRLKEAEAWFCKATQKRGPGIRPNVAMYNALLSVAAKSTGDAAEKWLRHMEENGILADKRTFGILIDACAKRGDLDTADFWLQRAELAGKKHDAITFRALLNAAAKQGNTTLAESWYSKALEHKRQPDIGTFNNLLQAAVRRSGIRAVRPWYDRAIASQASPDETTFSIAVHAAARAHNFTLVVEWLREASQQGVEVERIASRVLAKEVAQRAFRAMIQKAANDGDHVAAQQWAERAMQSDTQPLESAGATADTHGYPGGGALPEAVGETTQLIPGQEEAAVTSKEIESDKIPWQVGAENPIPEEMAKSLRVMERIVSQNVFHRQHMIYRNYPTLEELARLDEIRMEEALGGTTGTSGFEAAMEAVAEEMAAAEPPAGAGLVEADMPDMGDEMGDDLVEDVAEGEDVDKPALQDLFCFDAPQLTQGMTVTCAEWNSNNKDLLAVSYGDTAPVPINPGGLVLFWSLKNPTYPERVIRTRQGVTTLHFSSIHPNMVAAGAHDGSVMIWDLRRPSDAPVLRSGSSVSSHNDQKHTDIVWETRWVDQGPDKQPPELLVSVSSDGNVLQWSLKKGLEQMLLMPLKRIPNPYLGANCVYKHKEGIVSRKSSGFCIDFPRHDPSTYLVGTEDGLVHRCSTSYNEQFLDTYYGHSGPVYRVRCNPFMSHAFLTCSADWTMKLWTTKPPHGHPPETPLLTFQSTDLYDAVNDVVWAPQNSTSFAAAMDDGRIELWDLAEKPLDPIVVHYPQAEKPQRRRTCVRFSPNSPVLVAGDDQGSVDVMRMYNTNQSYYSDQEQQDRLAAVMVKKR